MGFFGCRSMRVDSKHTDIPNLNAIVLPQVSFHSNSVPEIVETLSQQIRAESVRVQARARLLLIPTTAPGRCGTSGRLASSVPGRD